MSESWFKQIREFGPLIILLSVLFGPLSVLNIAGRTPNLFWCDLLLLFFAGIELAILIQQHGQPIFKPYPFINFFFIYLVLASASLVWTADFLSSLAILKLRVVPLIAFAYIVAWGRSFNAEKHLPPWIVVTVGLLGLQIIWNLYSSTSSTLSIQELGEDVFSTKDLARTGIGKSNYLASILILVFPLNMFITKRSKGFLFTLLNIASLGLALFALMITQSRGAVICLLLGIIIGSLIYILGATHAERWAFVRWSLIYVLSGTMVVVLLWSWMPEDVQAEYMRTIEFLMDQWQQGNIAGNREDIWRAGMRHVFDSPILGIGLGNQQSMKQALEMSESTHNLYLDTFLELGVSGFIVLMGLFIGLMNNIYKGYFNATNADSKYLKLSVLSGMIIAMINAFQEPSFWAAQYGIVLWFLLGLGCLSMNQGKFYEVPFG